MATKRKRIPQSPNKLGNQQFLDHVVQINMLFKQANIAPRYEYVSQADLGKSF